MKLLFILFFTIIFFAGCDNNNGWPLADRQKGMKLCMDQTEAKLGENDSKKFCGCLMTKTMNKYPTYEAADKTITDEEGKKMGQSCLKELGIEANTGDENGLGEDKEKKAGGLFGGDDEENNGKKKSVDGEEGDVGSGWSTKDKNGFLTPCAASLNQQGYSNSQARQLCSCALEKLERKYSSLKDADNRGGEAAGAKVMQECANGSGDDN